MTRYANCCERLFGETETPTDKQMACERQKDSRLCTVPRKDIKQGGIIDSFSLTDRQNNKHRHGMHTDEKHAERMSDSVRIRSSIVGIYNSRSALLAIGAYR